MEVLLPNPTPLALLRLVPLILPKPDVPRIPEQQRPIATGHPDKRSQVPRGLVGPPLPHRSDHGGDARPEDKPQHQRREPRDHAAHPQEDLQREEQHQDRGGEDDDVGRVDEGLRGAVEDRPQHGGHDLVVEGREEVCELAAEGLEGRRGAEDVLVQEGAGMLGEEGCIVGKGFLVSWCLGVEQGRVRCGLFILAGVLWCWNGGWGGVAF